MRRKFDRLDAVVTLLSIIVVILITMMLTGCMTAKGLHYPNGTRNSMAKWQQHNEHGQYVVR